MKPQDNRWTARTRWWERMIIPFSQQIDWGAFWIREVVVLFVPWPIAVLTVPRSSYIRPAGVAILLAILLGLTIWNILWTLSRGSRSNPAHQLRSKRMYRGGKAIRG